MNCFIEMCSYCFWYCAHSHSIHTYYYTLYIMIHHCYKQRYFLQRRSKLTENHNCAFYQLLQTKCIKLCEFQQHSFRMCAYLWIKVFICVTRSVNEGGSFPSNLLSFDHNFLFYSGIVTKKLKMTKFRSYDKQILPTLTIIIFIIQLI